jgi:hypothetical protein
MLVCCMVQVRRIVARRPCFPEDRTIYPPLTPRISTTDDRRIYHGTRLQRPRRSQRRPRRRHRRPTHLPRLLHWSSKSNPHPPLGNCQLGLPRGQKIGRRLFSGSLTFVSFIHQRTQFLPCLQQQDVYHIQRPGLGHQSLYCACVAVLHSCIGKNHQMCLQSCDVRPIGNPATCGSHVDHIFETNHCSSRPYHRR